MENRTKQEDSIRTKAGRSAWGKYSEIFRDRHLPLRCYWTKPRPDPGTAAPQARPGGRLLDIRAVLGTGLFVCLLLNVPATG